MITNKRLYRTAHPANEKRLINMISRECSCLYVAVKTVLLMSAFLWETLLLLGNDFKLFLVLRSCSIFLTLHHIFLLLHITLLQSKCRGNNEMNRTILKMLSLLGYPTNIIYLLLSPQFLAFLSDWLHSACGLTGDQTVDCFGNINWLLG